MPVGYEVPIGLECNLGRNEEKEMDDHQRRLRAVLWSYTHLWNSTPPSVYSSHLLLPPNSLTGTRLARNKVLVNRCAGALTKMIFLWFIKEAAVCTCCPACFNLQILSFHTHKRQEEELLRFSSLVNFNMFHSFVCLEIQSSSWELSSCLEQLSLGPE